MHILYTRSPLIFVSLMPVHVYVFFVLRFYAGCTVVAGLLWLSETVATAATAAAATLDRTHRNAIKDRNECTQSPIWPAVH